MFFPKGALQETFQQFNFTERGLVTHFSNCAILHIKILKIQCQNSVIFICFPFPDHSAPNIQSLQSLLLLPNLFISFFYIKRKLCRFLFWMGPQNTKGASMGPVLKGLQESRHVGPCFGSYASTVQLETRKSVLPNLGTDIWLLPSILAIKHHNLNSAFIHALQL